jgi:hypothetical protein
MMGAAAAAEGGSSVTLIVDNSVPANARAAVREAVLDAVDRSTSCRFLEPPPLSTDELVVAVGCKSLTDQCAKALGATLKVDHVLLATAAADGNLRVSINPPRKKDLRAVLPRCCARGCNPRWDNPSRPGWLCKVNPRALQSVWRARCLATRR